jgi:hypothetical protein
MKILKDQINIDNIIFNSNIQREGYFDLLCDY